MTRDVMLTVLVATAPYLVAAPIAAATLLLMGGVAWAKGLAAVAPAARTVAVDGYEPIPGDARAAAPRGAA